jgi:hypothetical protein
MRIRYGKIRIRDQGSVMEISRIRDKHPGSATLLSSYRTQIQYFNLMLILIKAFLELKLINVLVKQQKIFSVPRMLCSKNQPYQKRCSG